MDRQALLIQLFLDRDRSAALPLADLLEEKGEEPYLAAGLRFCTRHDTWPEMIGGPNTIHGGSYRITGPLDDPEAQAVLCLLGILYPEKHTEEKTVVAVLGIILLALRYGRP